MFVEHLVDDHSWLCKVVNSAELRDDVAFCRLMLNATLLQDSLELSVQVEGLPRDDLFGVDHVDDRLAESSTHIRVYSLFEVRNSLTKHWETYPALEMFRKLTALRCTVFYRVS
jgi:hypothetical protein